MIILVSGHGKAHALQKVVEEGVNHMWTVSMLQLHRYGMIVCDEASRSELVVPLEISGRLVGVLDIDSPSMGRFSIEDQRGIGHARHRQAQRFLDLSPPPPVVVA